MRTIEKYNNLALQNLDNGIEDVFELENKGFADLTFERSEYVFYTKFDKIEKKRSM